ncbi:hypothetical protein F0562_021713 [Nyssa sinensis]|uniref:Uncharacterized protein n=1 Tax=Nyssa sinensis TaxID=561372 RepID=A0A5J5BQR9_9ASTE|nr:hypothetical protein F0562_021713 [Nyssa sinensis]
MSIMDISSFHLYLHNSEVQKAMPSLSFDNFYILIYFIISLVSSPSLLPRISLLYVPKPFGGVFIGSMKGII